MELKDGLSITVKAKFEVDEDTVRTCINLLNIYGQEKGLDGMILKFGDDGVSVEEVMDKYEMNRIMDVICGGGD